MNNEVIGKKLKVLRKTKGLTQQDLANLLGVQRATISNYEVGRRSPHIKELQRLSELLGVSLEYFGISNSEARDLIARAKIVFDDENIPHEEKANVYKEIMRLYLDMDK